MDARVMLDILGITTHTDSGDWINTPCLFKEHNHKNSVSTKSKARINSTGEGYRCFSCGFTWKGDADSLLLKLRNMNTDEGLDNTKVKAALDYVRTNKVPVGITLDNSLNSTQFKVGTSHQNNPEGDTPSLSTSTSSMVFFPKSYLNKMPSVVSKSSSGKYIHQEAVDYLSSRRVPMQVVLDFDIRYDYEYKRIVFPNYNNNKVLLGLKGRYIYYNPAISNIDKYKVYRHSPNYTDPKSNSSLLFFRHYQLDKKKPLILVEGEFDVARIYQSYRNVTCIEGVHIPPKKLEFLKKFKTLIYIPDNDKDGLGNVSKLIAILPNIKVLNLPSVYKDASATPAKEIRELLSPHLQLDPQLWTKAETLANK